MSDGGDAVLADGFSGLFVGCQNSGSEQLIDVLVNVQSREILSKVRIILRPCLLSVEFKQGGGLFLVQRRVVVLIDSLHRLKAFRSGCRGVGTGLQAVVPSAVERAGEIHELKSENSLAQELDIEIHLLVRLDSGGDVSDRGSVKLRALLVLIDPFLEAGLLIVLFLDDIQVLERLLLADPLLPAVRRARIFVGIFQPDRRILLHPFPHNVLSEGPGLDGYVVQCHHMVQLRFGLVSLRAARVAHNHRVVSLVDAFQGNLQRLFRSVRNIVL